MPGDACKAEKEKERKDWKVPRSKREITRLWNTKAYVVPVVVGALGMIPKYLKTISATAKGELLQKAQEDC